MDVENMENVCVENVEPEITKNRKLTPFINENVKINFAEEHLKELKEIRKWYHKLDYMPNIDDDYLKLFLHACYYNVEKTKKAMDSYFTLRADNPGIFSNRDIDDPKIRIFFEYGNMAPLPTLSPKGYNVLLYSLHKTEVSKFVFMDGLRAFCMYNDCRLSEDGLSNGYVILFDMKGLSISHLARVTFPPLRAFMQYIQDAHPARLKAIHILNTASFINHILRLVQPLIRTELMSIVKFHRNLPPEEDIPLEMMPIDYGGKAPLANHLSQQHLAMVERNYKEWLVESNALKCDLSKKPKKPGFFSNYFSSYFGGSNVANATVNNNNTAKPPLTPTVEFD